ncbi:sterile alpha motif domain-containing protein 1-like [Canis lupus dingo]|uniref:sterile alpha motif domain-containing protein 1-like n=1 Tax=Canis lupus dingo TaxID=286419 RepID=UPI0020C4E772|nr:sterile alpha motif domain-containing protein 1-like [Canis lupus dingo]
MLREAGVTRGRPGQRDTRDCTCNARRPRAPRPAAPRRQPRGSGAGRIARARSTGLAGLPDVPPAVGAAAAGNGAAGPPPGFPRVAHLRAPPAGGREPPSEAESAVAAPQGTPRPSPPLSSHRHTPQHQPPLKTRAREHPAREDTGLRHRREIFKSKSSWNPSSSFF